MLLTYDCRLNAEFKTRLNMITVSLSVRHGRAKYLHTLRMHVQGSERTRALRGLLFIRIESLSRGVCLPNATRLEIVDKKLPDKARRDVASSVRD
jgi:hypothetical protein